MATERDMVRNLSEAIAVVRRGGIVERGPMSFKHGGACDDGEAATSVTRAL